MSSENMTEYVIPPEGITLPELKEIIEFLINHESREPLEPWSSDPDKASDKRYHWWTKRRNTYLNEMTLHAEHTEPYVPNKTQDYLNSGGRYSSSTDYSQRYGSVREWHIRDQNKVLEDPGVPCLKVEPDGDSYRVTIINQAESGAAKGGRRRRRRRKRKSVKKTKKRRRRTRRRKRRRTRRRRR